MSNARIYSADQIKKIDPDLDLLSLITRKTAESSQTLVFRKEEWKLHILTTNNFPQLFHQVEDRLEIQWYETVAYYTNDEWFSLAYNWYQKLESKTQQLEEARRQRILASGQDAVAIIRKLVDDHKGMSDEEFLFQILVLSYQAWASDVHFQAEESGVVMRIRKDGFLQTVIIFPHAWWKKYLMKLKYMAWTKMNVDITSQDGRFEIHVPKLDGGSYWVDVRVSVMPWLRWESVVMRFLDSSKWLMTFDKIWFGKYHLDLLHRQLDKHYWLILVTWPTWSWKTTTVYSLINHLNNPDKKIITLEDPVEYELPWIEQSQINRDKGYTFEVWLTWVLRHDPDIIVVWEIRTLEAAEMVINAALTWHLVISTLHTNSAIESIARLVNMWVKPYMLATALNAVIGQRLVRRLAHNETYTPNSADDAYIKEKSAEIAAVNSKLLPTYAWTLLRPKWWERARTTWYEWRTALIEMLDVDDTITQAIMSWKNSFEISDIAQKNGFLTLEHHAIIKVIEWITSLAEVRRHLWK